MNLTIPKAQIQQLMDEIRRETVAQLLAEMSSVRLLSQTQCAALLDITTATLATLDLPAVKLAPTNTLRYRLTDVQAYIEKNYVTAR